MRESRWRRERNNKMERWHGGQNAGSQKSSMETE